SAYLDKRYDAEAMEKLRKDISEGLDVSHYANPTYNRVEMDAIKEAIDKDDSIKELLSKYSKDFNLSQINQIKSGLDKGLNISIYAYPKFNYKQMKQIKEGLEANININVYLDETINSNVMKEIKDSLINKTFKRKDFFNLSDNTFSIKYGMKEYENSKVKDFWFDSLCEEVDDDMPF
ncbi:MAG: hypothetical protein R3Y64_09270, partial [Peptostreptococcaceae bacterium]